MRDLAAVTGRLSLYREVSVKAELDVRGSDVVDLGRHRPRAAWAVNGESPVIAMFAVVALIIVESVDQIKRRTLPANQLATVIRSM